MLVLVRALRVRTKNRAGDMAMCRARAGNRKSRSGGARPGCEERAVCTARTRARVVQVGAAYSIPWHSPHFV